MLAVRTLALVWLVGGSLAASPHLLNFAREVRSRRHTAGGAAFQVMHYGWRARMSFWLWPVVLPFLAFLLGGQLWTRPTDGPDERWPLD